MNTQDGYAWFVALVWPDRQGTPTARVHQWDRQSGQIGGMVDSFTFGTNPTFYEVLAAKRYHPVDGVLEQPVQHDGVLIALRQEALDAPPYS